MRSIPVSEKMSTAPCMQECVDIFSEIEMPWHFYLANIATTSRQASLYLGEYRSNEP